MAKTKTAKRQKDIKSKLIAAICMLLVSTIMMVSSTYAWFTLSTAPEVTGITTQVGANGNLEMALMPKDGIVGSYGLNNAAKADENYGIKSEVGDSSKAQDLRNTTWGNLVDLSTPENGVSFYGLEAISLYPATLDMEEGKLSASMLQTPKYGADGRVIELVRDAVTSIYNSTSKSFAQDPGYGVRAIGTASGMTERELAYRNALSAANTSTSQAKIAASQSLQTNGDALANIAVEKAMGSGSYDSADIASLKAIVTDLLGDDDTTGVLEHIDNAYLKYLEAYFASNAAVTAGVDDLEFNAVQGIIEQAAPSQDGKTSATTNAINALASYGVTMPTQLTEAVGKLDATLVTVVDAQTELNALQGDTFTWNDIATPLTRLANMDDIMVNEYKAGELKEGDNMSKLVNSVASKGITVTMATGGGVYADVADHCGNYTASIKIAQLSAGGLSFSDIEARMQTETTVSPVYLSRMNLAVNAAGTPINPAVGGQTMPISDYYGFIIDLAFRTNAAESNLLLQTTPKDRIYSDNDSTADTMGAGSTMTFTATTTNFTADQMKGLMEAIRVVFFDPMTGEVLAYAKLDVDNSTVVGGNQVTASLYLYEVTAGTTTYTQVENEDKFTEYKDDETVLYTKAADSDTYTPVTDKTTIPADANYQDYYTAATTAGGETLITTATDAVITALNQNEAKAVSVLVYLEGAHIENADVAATASTSMTGTLNLQFASSATLVPMSYTGLQSQGGAQTPENGGGNP